jgi:acyl-CoA oxidase
MAFIQSYQLAEDLAKAFTERTILEIFLYDEMNVPDGSLKVYFLADPQLRCLSAMIVEYSLDQSFSILLKLSWSVVWPLLQEVFRMLRSLYVMVNIDESASFLRYGYLSRVNVAGVRKDVMKLCSELRPHALAVVSSFGIPDAFLSPLAFDWIEANALSSGSHWF